MVRSFFALFLLFFRIAAFPSFLSKTHIDESNIPKSVIFTFSLTVCPMGKELCMKKGQLIFENKLPLIIMF